LCMAELLRDRAQRAQILAEAKKPGEIKSYTDLWGEKYVQELRAVDREKLLGTAEKLFERVVADYADVKQYADVPEIGSVAKAALFEMRELQVGKTAPEITGKDVEKKQFKLSDYRGKVVVLIFCGHWCSACRSMYPTNRALVKEFANHPFALLEVSSDEDPAKVKELMEKGEINWRSWWDGGSTEGPIAQSWNVVGWPTVYVIDARGVIRRKGADPDTLGETVRALLKEAR
jgi:peroxiredoxin